MSKLSIIILSTIFILVIIFFVVPSIAYKLFNQKVNNEVKELFTLNRDIDKNIIQSEDIKKLPVCVQKWLKYSGVIGKENIVTVRLKQEAKMRLEKDKSWMPVKAEQYFNTVEPGFIWKARIRAAPFVHIVGRDKYFNGKGNMLIKLMSLITIADSKGEKINQGTMVRYLAESVWFPPAALSEYIKWENINGKLARATMKYGGITSSGIFEFNEKGEVINFTAERYRENNGQYTLETWSIDMEEYEEFAGIKIPVKGEVTWKLDAGDFTWFKFNIVDIDYNKPFIY